MPLYLLFSISIPNNINKILRIIIDNYKYNPAEFWQEYHYKIDYERNDSYIDNNYQTGEIKKTIE